ncbi:MAG: acetyltransferase [Clostridiales bacterium]|nr:acetyltransferase [Clostridiales bacterium]
MIGGGGHCRSVLDCLLEQAVFSEIAIVDDFLPLGTQVMGVAVIGPTDAPESYRRMGFTHAFLAIGSVGNPKIRQDFFESYSKAGFEFTNVIDKTAVVSRFASLGSGVFVGKRAIINAGVSLGHAVIVNTCAVIEHDCQVGDFAHVATAGVLCGGVKVGRCSHIGAQSVVRQGLRVGSDCVVGMGSLVSSNIPEGVTAYGAPCRVKQANVVGL